MQWICSACGEGLIRISLEPGRNVTVYYRHADGHPPCPALGPYGHEPSAPEIAPRPEKEEPP